MMTDLLFAHCEVSGNTFFFNNNESQLLLISDNLYKYACDTKHIHCQHACHALLHTSTAKLTSALDIVSYCMFLNYVYKAGSCSIQLLTFGNRLLVFNVVL